jgi:predicted 3-demethylubiquinone-9 3-methyltransferase (glyoxalase superfamily)
VKEVQVSGDLAYCRVHLDVRLTTPEGAEVNRLSGYALSVLRKQGGRWVIARDANFVAPVTGKAGRTVATQLMFDGRAEEAMRLYVSLFEGSEVKRVVKYGPGEHGKEGAVKRAEFVLAGHRLACIDSSVEHPFGFTPSLSLFVECGAEAEFDHAFAELPSGGAVLMPPNNYGFSARFAWLNDRFGVSWQLNLR